MTTRRRFLESLCAAGATLPALRDDALPRLAGVARHVDRRPADDVTRDEDFWREVQEAFTLDRTTINLNRSEEHTSELQSPYVISYAVFCLKKKKKKQECKVYKVDTVTPSM